MSADFGRRYERAARLRFLLWRAASERVRAELDSDLGMRRFGGLRAYAEREQWMQRWELELTNLKARYGANIGTETKGQ